MSASIRVHAVVDDIPKHPGVATSVRIVEVAGLHYLDLRDIISTPGEVAEGRGYLIPFSADLERIAKAISMADDVKQDEELQ